jgi:hypothetical protein
MRNLDPADQPTTSEKLVALYETTRPPLLALVALVAPHAAKQPAAPASPGAIDAARPLLGAVRKIVSREPGARALLELGAPLDWAGLAAKLAFATVALNGFHAKYRGIDPETLTGYWRTPGTAEKLRKPNDFDEIDRNLSTPSGAAVNLRPLPPIRES